MHSPASRYVGPFAGQPSRDRPALPSRPLIASVRSDPPLEPPDELVAFVAPKLHDGVLHDWELTSDVIAFAEPDLPQRFVEWRSQWVRTWPLEPLVSIRRLRTTLEDLSRADDAPTWHEAVSAVLASGAGVLVPPADVPALRDDIEVIRNLVAERDATGYGIVDASPTRTARGMAYSWSASGPPELVAGGEHMDVWMTPDRGLVVKWMRPTPDPRTVEVVDIEVAEVSIADDAMTIESVDGSTYDVPLDHARPLSWIVPGSQRWRIRAVPEIIVWAQTFAGLVECCDVAIERQLPVWFDIEPPVAAVSAPSTNA